MVFAEKSLLERQVSARFRMVREGMGMTQEQMVEAARRNGLKTTRTKLSLLEHVYGFSALRGAGEVIEAAGGKPADLLAALKM